MEEGSAGSSARRTCSLRKKVPQVLPRADNVACGRRFRRFFHGIRGRQCSSAGSRGRTRRSFFRWIHGRQRSFAGARGRTCRSFFRWIKRKNLLPLEPTEEPFHLSSAGARGRTPSSATIPNVHFHMRRRRFFSRKNLRLQPQAPNITNVVYPTTIYAIQTETRLEH